VLVGPVVVAWSHHHVPNLVGSPTGFNEEVSGRFRCRVGARGVKRPRLVGEAVHTSQVDVDLVSGDVDITKAKSPSRLKQRERLNRSYG